MENVVISQTSVLHSKPSLKRSNPTRSNDKGKQGSNEMYTTHEANFLIKKKLKKAFKGRKIYKQELHTFEKMDVSESEKCTQSYDETKITTSNAWKKF